MAGSYNSLVEENRKLSEELRALPIDVTSEQFKNVYSDGRKPTEDESV